MNLFGGLLDRCIPNPFAEVYNSYGSRQITFNGITYLGNISNITLDSIASLPVKVCFCNTQLNQQDCSYQPSHKKVMKGEIFFISVVALDHITNPVETRVNSSLVFPNGGFAEGQ